MRIEQFFLMIFLITSLTVNSQEIFQWRGSNRDGIYKEEKLLKSWSQNGPNLLWVNENIGDGFGSVAVAQDMIFVNGKVDSLSYTIALDLNGKIIWKTPNGIEFAGKEFAANFPGSRSTPTVFDNLVYVLSGNGRLACLEKQTGKEKWAIDVLKDFDGKMDQHGYCESLLVDEEHVYCLPGGKLNNVVAINKFTGKTVWTSGAMADSASYCSPQFVKLPTRNILVTFSGHHLLGIDTKTGKLLWSQPQAYHLYHQQCNTPIFDNGYIYYNSGEGNGAVKLELSPDGSSIKEIWRNPSIKNVFYGFVKIKDHLYSPEPNQKLKCLDIETGAVRDSINVGKGSLIYADGMLYCYSDNGTVSLIKLDGTKMEVVSKFKCNKGTKEHFAHPVISNGVLYIRHGKALMAYDIKGQ
jgi:outer membrane protein assembly factor BamB